LNVSVKVGFSTNGRRFCGLMPISAVQMGALWLVLTLSRLAVLIVFFDGLCAVLFQQSQRR
jgi:hypothetical protein